ncbi:acyloxyacyl hydrolase [Dichotomicrobium thermohalophilum]|uniref:Lipid A 3-O-deacylase PagL n=1 Tax=Dichotomicrobium thermohalophilum TaxID=933063 RepID=A0A397Q6U5_9HYPH|nr:acyloxyacyl hydrolase [Dichotomicrobium thermohalophilum]RIA55515.1 lipid A 3-O-deacylase PagL [Dichotomicrobium thermohalophilum]
MIRQAAARLRRLYFPHFVFGVAALAWLLSVVAAFAEPAPRAPGLVDEVRLGVLAHDLETNDNEDGWDINAELLLHRLGPRTGDPLGILLSPRPHVGAQINTSGDTSLAYFGLTWDAWLTDSVFIEGSFGGAIHNGPTGDSHNSFGCTANFRESAALGIALSPEWKLLATVSHMSNGGLCDENQGLTSAGVQLGYRW